MPPAAASNGVLTVLGEDIGTVLTRPWFHLGTTPVSLAFLVKALAVLVLIWAMARLSRRLVRRHVLDRTSLDIGQKYAAEKGIGYLVLLVGLLVGLQSAGLDLSSLVVVGGAVGIGIGFGLQAIAKNFISGLLLLIERPVKVGDRVEVGELNGDVVQIGARATWIRTNDNIMVIVPNAEFIETRVTNWTAIERRIRVSVPVGVSYASDPERVREVLVTVAREHPHVLASPEPDVIFRGFGESSLDFDLRVWTSERVQTPQILRSELYFPIFAAFREAGIEIPFPQRDVHLKGPLPAAPPEEAR